MDINATLIGQMITFGLFVWFTMKFVWPPLDAALTARQKRVSEGLAAAERGQKELEISQKYAIQHIHEARVKAQEILDLAKKQGAMILEESKILALEERQQIVAQGQIEVRQQQSLAREQLKNEVVGLALKSAEALLSRRMTEDDQKMLMNLDTHFKSSNEAFE